MQNFKRIEISGSARQRGLEHGRQLRGEIAKTLAFYHKAFGLSDNEIMHHGAHFKRVIQQFNPDYATEIEAIAEGAELDELRIFALNARTEILALGASTDINECTSICFPDTRVLGQTWDWGRPMEDLCVVMRIAGEDGHVIQMLCEPGIIGKIGMNNAGLGVCLNILMLNQPLKGVPIHVMLRAILDCRTAGEANKIIDRAASGKSSNVMVADKSGACFDLEFAGDETLALNAINGIFIHTNHYLGKQINASDDPEFENSRTRMHTATTRISQAGDHTADSMKAILSERAHGDFPIFRQYIQHDELGDVGTVATLVMELAAQKLHIRKGSSPDAEFATIMVE